MKKWNHDFQVVDVNFQSHSYDETEIFDQKNHLEKISFTLLFFFILGGRKSFQEEKPLNGGKNEKGEGKQERKEKKPKKMNKIQVNQKENNQKGKKKGNLRKIREKERKRNKSKIPSISSDLSFSELFQTICP